MLQTNQPPQLPPRAPARPQQRQAKARTNSSWQVIAFVLLAAAAGITAITIAGVGLLILASPPRVASNVTVAGVNISGLTETDAAAALRSGLPTQQLTLTDGARQWVISPADIGIGIDLDATIDKATSALGGSTIAPVYTVDLTAAQNGLLRLASQINVPPQPQIVGRELDAPIALDRLRVDAPGEIADGVFELDMVEIPALPAITTTHIVEQGQELALIARQYGVTIQDILDFNDIANADLIYPGQELIIPAEGEYIPENIPAAPTNSGRSIVVSTGDQRIYAYENGQMVRTHLVSTGTMVTPTVLGDYAVYVKYRATDMSGPGYFMPQVPYTMYFYQGYGIHGTYWHNAFGRTMSHGCVNLPVAEAEWFFNFASVGTPVRVI